MKLGMVVFAADLNLLKNFYARIFDLQLEHADDEHARLTAGSLELVILQIADHYLQKNEPDLAEPEHQQAPAQPNKPGTNKPKTNKPGTNKPRTMTPLKPVFFGSRPLHEYRQIIKEQQGAFNDADTEWSFEGNTVCDGWDPEGNVFQIRSPG